MTAVSHLRSRRDRSDRPHHPGASRRKPRRISWKRSAYLNAMDIQGIKLQLLHVLRGTDLAADHEAGLFRTYERDEYLDLVIDCLEQLQTGYRDPPCNRRRSEGSSDRTFMGQPQTRSFKPSSSQNERARRVFREKLLNLFPCSQ